VQHVPDEDLGLGREPREVGAGAEEVGEADVGQLATQPPGGPHPEAGQREVNLPLLETVEEQGAEPLGSEPRLEGPELPGEHHHQPLAGPPQIFVFHRVLPCGLVARRGPAG